MVCAGMAGVHRNKRGNGMRKNASGVYVIDGDFTVLSFNPATGQLYPKLRVGEEVLPVSGRGGMRPARYAP